MTPSLPSTSLSTAVPAGIPFSLEIWAGLPVEVRGFLLAQQAQLAAQQERIEALEAIVAALQARLGLDSSNSSKPPSSDPPKAKAKARKRRKSKRRKGSGRKAGAQPGHKGTKRAIVPPEQVTRVVQHFPSQCRDCQRTLAGLLPAGAPERRQVFELPEIQPEIIEHQLYPVRCSCGCLTTADVPPEAKTGLGLRATAMAALMVGRFRLSRSQVSELFTDQFHIPLSKGAVQAACMRVSTALAPTVDALQAALLDAWSLHADETGWREAGKRHWLWVFVAAQFTVFVVHARRGRQVLEELGLDAWQGYLHSDRWTVYNRHPAHRRQLCWAHLLRDLQGLIDAGGTGSARAAEALSGALMMFHHWHALERGEINRAGFQSAVAPFRVAFRVFCEAGRDQDDDVKWRALGRELLKRWVAVFRFVDIEGLEPTNNRAERAIRAGVIWRRLTQGTRSAAGSTFAGRILSVIETCRQQDLEVYNFLESALRAHLHGLPPPSLLPAETTAQQRVA